MGLSLLTKQSPHSSACCLPTGTGIHFLSFLFVLSHRDLTPAKYIPRLPTWAVGASNGSQACRREIKIRGLPLPWLPHFCYMQFLNSLCVLDGPSSQPADSARFSCHLAASAALFIAGTSAFLYLSSPGSQSGSPEVLISELLHLLPFVLPTLPEPLKLLLFIKFC